MTTIDVSKPPVNFPQFLLLRSEALDAYSRVEQSLCNLLTTLLGVAPHVGAIVFFSLVNASARRRMIEELFEATVGDQFNVYLRGRPNTPNRKGLFNLLSELDGSRNEIVHWCMVHQIKNDNTDGLQVGELELVKPNFWARQNSLPVTDDVLRNFISKARFVSLSIGYLATQVNRKNLPSNFPKDVGSLGDVWEHIFAEPCTYPPPASHPLC